jgi:D-glycero-alpha-D-manno-heptose 1-phosphate guanylyltransferase
MNIFKIDVDVVILCGGLGTRLKTLFPNTPKALASINGVPFLDKLMKIINKQGFEKFILCVGHLKQQIIDRYSKTTNFDVRYSLETDQLGTGGAIKNALPLIENKFFIAMNGDSFCNVSLKSLIEFHQKNNADISIVISPADIERDDVGNIVIDKNNKIISFSEKTKKTPRHYINAGIYVINKSAVDSFDAEKFSLEVDLFPKLIKIKNIYGFETSNLIYDIGTPKRYKKFINEDFL